jgi:hypothetical protein
MHDAGSDHGARFCTRRSNCRGDRRRGQVFKRELIDMRQSNDEMSEFDLNVGKSGIDG